LALGAGDGVSSDSTGVVSSANGAGGLLLMTVELVGSGARAAAA